MSGRIHVLVIGGGIGGLCLAQGLRQAGVGVAVYERNRARTDWLQGYRIHISPHGSGALHDCLPADLWDAFLATAGRPSAGFAFLTEQLRELLFLGQELIGEGETDPASSHHSISRITLRQVLLGRMDEVVQYGKEFVGYERTRDGRVTARFADGTSALGDVLVAADGANSRVRQQYLPCAKRIDTGVIAVAGKLALNDETRAWLPPRLTTSVNNIMPPSPDSMFTAIWEGQRVEAGNGIGGNDDPSQLRPGMLFDNTRDYVFWSYTAKASAFPKEIERLEGLALQRIVRGRIGGWHPDLVRLVTASDPETVGPVRIRSMERVEPWDTSNVTLIGDAIHNMTPMAGIGANTALRDASLLCRKLTEVDRGQAELLPAVREYEAAMREYGFAAVELSLRNARQATSESRLGRSLFRAVLRLTNALPPVKRRWARALGR